jgi:hypothetical protein
MAQINKNSFSGVKIQQTPGGNSNFSLDWGHKDTFEHKKVTKQETQPSGNITNEKIP